MPTLRFPVRYSTQAAEQYFRQHLVEREISNAHDQLGFLLVESLSEGLVQALNESHRSRSKMLIALGEVFSRRSQDRERRQTIHLQVARSARDAIVGSYDQRVVARETAAGRLQYRAGASGNRAFRFAGGALKRALQSDNNYDGHPDGIRLINEVVMDKEAAHWYRLNFGVGQRGQRGQQGRYGIKWGGLIVGALGFESGPSRRPMVLPPGFFIGPEGERIGRDPSRRGLDPFYPGPQHRRGGVRGFRRQTPTVTRGIEARNFLDAGLRQTAELLPRAYEDYYRETFAEFVRTGKGVLKKATVRPRPVRQRPQVLTLRAPS